MKIWTTRDVLAFAAEDFKKRGLESPRLEAEILLCHVLACPRLHLYTEFDRPLVEGELNTYRNAITRRRNGEPAAYIIGKKEFWSLEFEVNPSVLIPRPETEILVEHALERLRGGHRALDLCTGSGCIAIALAVEKPELQVDAVDISEAACQVAERNASAHKVSERFQVLRGDLFSALPPEKRYDLITANPPYVAEAEMAGLSREVQNEPRLALAAGAEGLDIIRRIVAEAPSYLNPGGSLLMEIDPRQTEEVVQKIGKPAFGEVENCDIIKDLAGKERVLAWQMPDDLAPR